MLEAPSIALGDLNQSYTNSNPSRMRLKNTGGMIAELDIISIMAAPE